LRSKLSIADYICLRMAEGMTAMAEEAMEPAIGHFDFVLSLEEELDDRFLLAIVYFWKGRCLRRRGEYDEALIYTVKGKELALALGHPRMAAVMQVLEGWLFFQQGKWKEAVRISQAAKARCLRDRRLCDARQHPVVSTGAWRAGKGVSIKRLSFSKAPFAIMAKRDPRHLNLARSLANMALAKRGIALQLQKRIDRDVQRRRKTSASRVSVAQDQDVSGDSGKS
jgi:tetratricopeptide (TPR) repeat protein